MSVDTAVKKLYTYDRKTRKHAYQLLDRKPKDGFRDVQSNAAYHRWAITWNDLPRIVVDAGKFNMLKNRLNEARGGGVITVHVFKK